MRITINAEFLDEPKEDPSEEIKTVVKDIVSDIAADIYYEESGLYYDEINEWRSQMALRVWFEGFKMKLKDKYNLD